MQMTARVRRRRTGEHRPAPAGRIELGRVAEARPRNPGWLLAGVLLVLISAIGGVLLFSAADDRTAVLVAAGDIEPGEPVRPAQLRVVELSSAAGVATLGRDDASALVGRLPIGPIPAGTVLNPSMFRAGDPLTTAEVVFGAALDPGEAPVPALAVGTAVRLLVAPRSVAGASAEAGAAPAAEVIGDGIVWGREALGSGQVWLSVRSPVEVGLRAARAAQDDELRVVVVGDAAPVVVDDGAPVAGG